MAPLPRPSPVASFLLPFGAIALVTSVGVGIGQVDGVDRLLLIVAVVAYLLGVQLPTVTKNIPLNNALTIMDVNAMNDPAHHAARIAFEPRWNQWNAIRTAFAGLTSALLIILVFRL